MEVFEIQSAFAQHHDINRLDAKMKAKPHCWWYFVVILSTIESQKIMMMKHIRQNNLKMSNG
ncbi:CLUMA_CG010946, isoform A [Clunio marinus]|uniref:CLUMA_CG010946, isoform A n=1 Tax=Clunio marinus TaxID=568069 RepID=A0A1J1IBE9_9DIPT|nr:CLUMA_CG010946, isoform A [Clunio marinus]